MLPCVCCLRALCNGFSLCIAAMVVVFLLLISFCAHYEIRWSSICWLSCSCSFWVHPLAAACVSCFVLVCLLVLMYFFTCILCPLICIDVHVESHVFVLFGAVVQAQAEFARPMFLYRNFRYPVFFGSGRCPSLLCLFVVVRSIIVCSCFCYVLSILWHVLRYLTPLLTQCFVF